MSIFYDERLLDHYHWPGHPESPERLQGIVGGMGAHGLWRDVRSCGPCTQDDVLRVHTRGHLERIRDGREFPIDMDTFLREETCDLAMLAAGCALGASRAAYDERAPSLALVRPPGHHAGPDYCGAFCYFNNAAIAAEGADAERVAIVDLDAHHGNGTMDVFYDRSDVLYASFHEYNLYPRRGEPEEVGEGEGAGYTINVPFSIGAGDMSYFYAWNELLCPILKQFGPDLVVVSLGADAHYMDPESYLEVTTRGYLEICKRIISISKGRAAFVLEGGYSVEATTDVLCSIMSIGDDEPHMPVFVGSREMAVTGKAVVDRTVGILSDYWDLRGSV